MRTLTSVAFSISILLWGAKVEAHIQLSSPTARYVQDNNGLKTAPCGSGTTSGAITKVAAGQSLTVTWKESVSHAGHYRIALSAKESDFVEPTSLAIPNPLPAWDLMDGIPDKTGTQTYSQTVQLPNVECPACVLQLIQVMSAGTDGTNTGSFSGVYHACADLAITGGGGDAGLPQDAMSVGDARPGSPDLRAAGGAGQDAVAGAGGMIGGAGGVGAGVTGAVGGHEAGVPGGSGGAPGGLGGDSDSRGRAGTGGQTDGTGAGTRGGGAVAGGTDVGGTAGPSSAGGLAAGGSMAGLGGAASGSGGAAGTFAGRGGAGGDTGASRSPSSPAGCSLGVASSSAPSFSWLWFAVAVLCLGRLRAKRRLPSG